MPDGMTRPMLPAVEKFVVEMRKLCEAEVKDSTLWEKSRELLADLIADPGLKAHARNWPVTGYNPETNKVSNLLFYEDPDYGFVINALIKNPGGSAMIHDHGPSWTIYGVLQGQERIVHYNSKKREDGNFDISEKGTYTLVIETTNQDVVNAVGGIGHVPDGSAYSISIAGFAMLLIGMVGVVVVGVILVRQRKRERSS